MSEYIYFFILVLIKKVRPKRMVMNNVVQIHGVTLWREEPLKTVDKN